MREVVSWQGDSPFLYGFESPVEISGIPQRDRGNNQVERHHMEILLELRPIRYGAAPVKTNGALERVVGFPFVQPDQDAPAEFRILEPGQRKIAMPHRELLTESQRLSFQTPGSDEREMVRHYTLSSEDLALINHRPQPLRQS